MKIAPDLDYMLEMGENLSINKYLVRDSDLSGIVMFCTLDDRYINGWQHRDGVVYRKLAPANGEETETPATVSGTRSEDWHIVLDKIISRNEKSRQLALPNNLYDDSPFIRTLLR